MTSVETSTTNSGALVATVLPTKSAAVVVCRCQPTNRSSSSRSSSGRRRRKWSELSSRSRSCCGDSSEDDSDWKRYYDYSTFHGVRDWCHAGSWFMRILWTFTLMFAVGYTFYGCYAIITEYIERPVVVSYIQASVDNLALPDIVVCPFNRFNRSFLEEHEVSPGLAQYLELSFPSQMHSFQEGLAVEVISNVDHFEYELEQMLEKFGNISYTEFIHMATLDCSAFFVELKNCSNLTEIMTSAGKCFRIPGDDQQGDGFGYGTRVVIRLPHKLYNPGVNQMLNDGIAVKLAERNRGIDHDLTFIPSGVHAIMPLSATRYDFLNDPPRYTCDHDANQTYSRVWCFDICLTSEAEEVCQCSLAAAAVPRKPLLCTTKQFYHCYFPVLFKNYTDLVSNCKIKCPSPCSFWQYHKTVSYAQFPAPHARFFVDNDTEWDLLTNTIILEVFYTTMDYTVIKHMVSMTPNSFVAQIGGQVSLWIGGSLISVFQLIIWLIRYFCGAFKERRSRHGRKRRNERSSGNKRSKHKVNDDTKNREMNYGTDGSSNFTSS